MGRRRHAQSIVGVSISADNAVVAMIAAIVQLLSSVGCVGVITDIVLVAGTQVLKKNYQPLAAIPEVTIKMT